jgi:hypothetical protein
MSEMIDLQNGIIIGLARAGYEVTLEKAKIVEFELMKLLNQKTTTSILDNIKKRYIEDYKMNPSNMIKIQYIKEIKEKLKTELKEAKLIIDSWC